MRPDEATVQDTPTLDHSPMLEAMKLGVAEALRNHRDHGVPVVTWDAKTKQTVEIPADQIAAWIEATKLDR